MSVEVNNESDVEVDADSLAQLARFVLDSLRLHQAAELSIMLVDEVAMTTLHEQWMDESGPTDVMAFPMDEIRTPRPDAEPEPGLLGDVVICPQVARKQARAAKHAFADELYLLCTHGILHLLGYDHFEVDERKEMFALQGKLLAAWSAVQSGDVS